MKMEVTELGPMKRALKIEVPVEEVDQRFVQAYTELNRQVRIPGFRPGKAPLELLQKRYAKAVEEDVLRGIVPDYYDRAIRQAGIVPILVEIPPLERVKIKRGSPFTFTATVEIRPHVQLRDYKAPNPISLKPDKRTVTDEQIDRALAVLQEQQAQLHAAPAGHGLSEGDYAVLDIEGMLEGVSLDGTKKEGHLHKVGSKVPVLGVDFDAVLPNKREGDAVEVIQPYPSTHPDSRVAGKTVMFRATIRSVKQKHLPALDDEFAKDCGPYQTLHELKDKLRGEMERALKKDIEDSYKDAVLKRLLETHHFELPETLVERELSSIVRQHLQTGRRKSASDVEATARPEELAKLRDEHRAEAERRVKAGLILEAVAEKEGLTVTDEDVRTEVARLAAQVKMPPAEIERMVQAGGQEALDEMRGRILADKALDFVYRHAVIQG